jgi:hypothetical protein
MRYCWILLLLLPCVSIAQKAVTAPFVLPKTIWKIDLAAVGYRSLGLAVELKSTSRISWEFHLGMTDFYANDGLIERTQVAEYQVEEIYSTGWGETPGFSSKRYVGSGRPLEGGRENSFHPMISTNFRFGCQTSLPFGHNKWRVTLLPTIHTQYVVYLDDSLDEIWIDRVSAETWQQPVAGSTDPLAVETIKHSLIDYRQTRERSFSEKIHGGIGYEIGVSRFLGRRLIVEGRYRRAMNFAGFDIKDGLPPSLQRNFGHFSLHVGWCIR